MDNIADMFGCNVQVANKTLNRCSPMWRMGGLVDVFRARFIHFLPAAFQRLPEGRKTPLSSFPQTQQKEENKWLMR